MKKIILGIFDDHPFFIKGLTDFLEQHDFISIGFAASTKDDLDKELNNKLPDILIMDVLAPEETHIKTIFTPRESQITKLIATGQTSDLIAKELGVSLRTIENIKVNLFKKLEVKNAAELILVATRLGYVS